ncbi:MAG: hypothetical protein N4A49_12940 [Marinifilaceae bacterium]|jgi:regulator of RNase E activity RraB|nr:hypothetical protein [Marinifilaceae bacterium]
MKKILLTMACLGCLVLAKAQTVYEKYPTGAKAQSDQEQRMYNKHIKNAVFSNSLKRSRVDEVHFIDNSKLKYFRPIFRQHGGSCAQAAGIGYIYTYEVNCMLDRDSKDMKNRFSYMFSWNYLNNGKGDGSNEYEGWNIIRDNGAIVESDWDTDSYTRWPNGYDIYENAFKYSVEEYTTIRNDRQNYKETITKLKQYLIDHGNGSKYGGVLTISGYAHSLYSDDANYTGPSYTNYDCIIPKFSDDGAHCMTLVGFDDKVEWDLDKDGEIADDERGAFIIVNSWGDSFGDNGRFYYPYKMLSKSSSNGGPFSEFLMVKPKIIEPKLYYKVKMAYSSRNDLSFELGVSVKPGATEPEKVFRTWAMLHAGGDLPISGLKPEAMFPDLEFALRAEPLLEYIGDAQNPKFYLKVATGVRGEPGEGELISFKLIDNRDANNKMVLDCINTYENVSAEKSISLDVREVDYEFEKQKVAFALKYNEEGEHILYMDSNEESELKAEIIDGQGKVLQTIFDGKIDLGFGRYKIKTDGIQPGTYAIRIFCHNQVSFKKIQIK